MKPNTFVNFVCALLVLLFIYTAVTKLLGMRAFINTLSHVKVIEAMPSLVAYVIIGVELMIAGMLLFDQWRFAGLVLSVGLLGAFTVFIGTLLLLGSRLPCNCGGVVSSMSWKQHIFFNLFLIVLAVIALKILTRQTGEAENLQNRVGKN